MAHEITATDNVISYREEMWHGLGNVLPERPTLEQTRQLVHPWDVIEEQVYRRTFSIVDGQPVERFEEIPSMRANVRSDTDEVLGVVPSTLVNVPNTEMYDIAATIEGIEKDSVKVETAGSLAGGKKVWLLLLLNEPIIIPGDPNGTVRPYLAIQNDHSGMGSFRASNTLVRIVCGNTQQMSDLDAQAAGTEFVFNHTKNVRERIEEAKQALAGWREGIRTFNRLATHLVDMKITQKQQDLFIEEFHPLPASHASSERVVANVLAARQAHRDLLASPTNEGIDLTAWGLVQSSVEYRNWVQKARTETSRFRRAYLTKDAIVADAVKLAQEVATL